MNLQLPTIGQTLNYGNLVNKDWPVNKGLVSRWLILPLNRGGAKILDIADVYPANLTNVSWAGSEGRPGGFGSLEFEGSGSRFGSTGNLSRIFNSLTGLSMFGWVRHDTVVNSQQTTMMLIDEEGGFDFVEFQRQHGADLFEAVMHQIGTGTNTLTTAMLTGWFFFTMTWQSGGNISLYLNGTLKDSEASVISTFNSANRRCTMFLGSQGSTEHWEGPADDFGWYNRCLNSAEVLALYEDSRQGYPNSLNWLSNRIYGFFSPCPDFVQSGGALGGNFPIKRTYRPRPFAPGFPR